MLTEYALLKLQTITGQEHFLHSLPALLCSKRARQPRPASHHERLELLPLTNIIDTASYHALLYHANGDYHLVAITPLLLDNQPLHPSKQLQAALDSHKSLAEAVEHFLNEVQNSLSLKGENSHFSQEQENFKGQENNGLSLKENHLNCAHQEDSDSILPNICRLTVLSEAESEVYYICQPSTVQQRLLPVAQKPSASLAIQAKSANLPAASGSKWSSDDHEQLKKLLLQYGYGRWKQIQRSSLTIGGKLENKPLPEIKAYANSFLRALGLSLPEDETNLKLFLQKLIEENQTEYNQFQPHLKEWDQHIMLPQRSIQYTKRLQLLYRVRNLIHKYREDSLKNMSPPDRRKMVWEGLLNFIPLGLLFGQRPAVWWGKKNDIDLLLGVYKYGYANYVSIRNAKEYCFAELERAQTYQDFPVADNLTRRLKKLINTIVKIQQNQGEIDFEDEAESEEDEKSWGDAEKRILFSIVSEFGVSIGSDCKSNWGELKDRLKVLIKDFNKTPSQIEKMVSRLRWNCQEITSDEKLKEDMVQGSGSFKITFEMATKFIKNISILEFVRRSIMLMEANNLRIFLKEVEEKNDILSKDHPAFIEGKSNDQAILNHVNKNGICGFSNLKLNEAKVLVRMEWLCEIYKVIKEKVQDKKKKYNKTFDDNKKKAKFQINRDKDGNIRFPININPSLILVATGRVNVNPNYHSEHNLFPVGYISIRTHASMFTRGVRARYTCEILEGDGKPIYKVTPEEDPTNSIMKDSSTGCWVYICNRVNQLQEVKKEKVTISGTERFGLLEPNVVRLLEDLENAEKCNKYKFKKNLPKDAES